MTRAPSTGLGDGKLQRGTRLGRYTILSHLATGGMAEIYLARAEGIQGFERLVVVKRILPHWSRDPHFIEMFLDEARLAATLQHPNIAQVFDIGEHEGSYFFTMEFVHGADARRMFRKNKASRSNIPLEHTLQIIIQAAGALHYAHEKRGGDGSPAGIVHRDVSPSNILVTYDGAVKVVDFGVAKAAGRRRETSTGTLKGKISYMSPEQCRAEPLDRRSDVFGLGIVMHELLTGKRLFEGDSDLAVLSKIVDGPVERPSTLAETPTALDAIVSRALAKAPDERFQSAEELQIELENFAHHNKLLTSQRALGQYMRTLFPKELDAWESAQAEGKSLAAHLVETNMLDLTPSGLQPYTPSAGLAPLADPFAAEQTARPESSPPTETVEPVLRASSVADPEPHARSRWLRWLVLLVASAAATVVVLKFVVPAMSDDSDAVEQPAAAPAADSDEPLSEEAERLERLRQEAEQERRQLEAERERAAAEKAALERLRRERDDATSATEPGLSNEDEVPAEPETQPETDKKGSKRRAKTKTRARTKPKSTRAPSTTPFSGKKKRQDKRNSDSLFLPSRGN